MPRPKKIINKIKKPRTRKSKFSRLRGMKDVLPKEYKYWNLVIRKASELAKVYGFERIETPILEHLELYERSTGKDSDIVSKEMFTFIDKNGEKVALRPEATPGLVRSYIEHGMFNLPQPVKLFWLGPLFRHEKPQLGRFRQHSQFNLEILGEDSPVADAQLILIAYNFFRELQIEVQIQINSIGCSECRQEYITKLIEFYKERGKRAKLCFDCKKRIVKNPLRLLDCKEEKCIEIRSEAPQIVDWLCDSCRDHFIKVLEYLDELDILYNLDPYLVRGLDYYNRTVFEIWPSFVEATEGKPSYAPTDLPAVQDFGRRGADGRAPSLKLNATRDRPKLMASDEALAGKETSSYADASADKSEGKQGDYSRQSSLGGGGRYDGLVEQMGGRPTAACGFGLGIERTILKIKEKNIPLKQDEKGDIFLAQLGEQARRKAILLFEELRRSGISIRQAFTKDSLKAQLEVANRLGVKYSLILGQKEIMDGTILIRDMESGIQEVIDCKKLVPEIEKRLSNGE